MRISNVLLINKLFLKSSRFFIKLTKIGSFVIKFLIKDSILFSKLFIFSFKVFSTSFIDDDCAASKRHKIPFFLLLDHLSKQYSKKSLVILFSV